MHNFVHDMLHSSPAALRIEAFWQVRLSALLFLCGVKTLVVRNTKQAKPPKQNLSKVKFCIYRTSSAAVTDVY